MVSSIRIPVDGTVASHVTSTSANTTDDVCGEVTLLWAIILAMSNTTTVLTNLVFVVTESTVESGKFAKLVALVVILTLGSGSSLEISVSRRYV